MRSRDDINSFLVGSGYVYEEIGEGTWLVEDPQQEGQRVVVRLEEEVVLFRLKVLALNSVKQRDALFAKLLQLNAADMVHGAYGLADDAIVLTCVLRSENLDPNEFRGTIDDFMLALSNHREILSGFC